MLAVTHGVKMRELTEPKGHGSHDTERNSESPLSRELGIRRVSRSMVENQEQDNQHDLIEQLTPT